MRVGNDVLEFFKVRGQGRGKSIQLGFMVAAQVADLHTEHTRNLNPQVTVSFLMPAGADTQGNKSLPYVVVAGWAKTPILRFPVGAVWVGEGVGDFPHPATVELRRGLRLRDLGLSQTLQNGVHVDHFSTVKRYLDFSTILISPSSVRSS